MNPKAIYPEIGINILHADSKVAVRVETYLRKTYRRKYYLWKFYKEYEFNDDSFSEDEMFLILKRLSAEVYRTIILGKVDPKCVLHTGGICRPAFKLDPDQTPEHVRLIQTQFLKK